MKNLSRLFLSIGTRIFKKRERPFRQKIAHDVRPYVNRIIADAILLNEIPSPTEREELRVSFITRRLEDFGVSNIAVDESGNVYALFPAYGPTDEYVLLFADMENKYYSPLDSLVKLERERASGRGIADNSIGVATLLVLAEYIQKTNLLYEKNLLLLFTNFEATEPPFAAFENFIRHWKGKISFALYVTGLQLGFIETKPLGNCKLAVTVKTGESTVLQGEKGASAVSILSNIAFQLGNIHWDDRNETTLNVARLQAGTGYGYFPSEGVMEIEILSGDMSVLNVTKSAVCATIKKIAGDTGARIEVKTDSLIPVGNAEINRFLTSALEEVHRRLGIRSSFVSTTDKTAVLNSLGIPALSVGITSGKKSFSDEHVDLSPIETGFDQLLTLLDRTVAMPEGSPGP